MRISDLLLKLIEKKYYEKKEEIENKLIRLVMKNIAH